MNPSPETLDARGLACPQPVILARRALARGAAFEILVDEPAARENLLKFAAHAGCEVEAVVEEGREVRIRLRPPGAAPGAQTLPMPAIPSGTAALLLATDTLGRGDAELGALLMRGFVYALAESEAPPRRLLLMNAGVRLAVEGSESLAHLRRLADAGVEVVACGTCLEFFKLTGQLAVGRVGNMYEITEALLEGPSLTLS